MLARDGSIAYFIVIIVTTNASEYGLLYDRDLVFVRTGNS